MKKPIRNIIPRIHNLKDFWFIQWIGNEYYIKKSILNRIFNIYALIQYLILLLILNIAHIKFYDFSDFLRALIISLLVGIISGLAIVEDRYFKN